MHTIHVHAPIPDAFYCMFDMEAKIKLGNAMCAIMSDFVMERFCAKESYNRGFAESGHRIHMMPRVSQFSHYELDVRRVTSINEYN